MKINIQVKIVLAVTVLYNFIQLYWTTKDIYNKAQLNTEPSLMHLSYGKEEVIN